METAVAKKQIQLDETEVQWIKLIKGHYKKKYKTDTKNWIDTLAQMFDDSFGWSHIEYRADFLQCMFQKLLSIYLKIQDDRSGNNVQLKEIIEAGFVRSIRRDYELPIERVIAELCGHIQMTTVIDHDGFMRFNLDI